MTKHKNESGIASILTVIFFILIISVITLGFLRITIQEGNQTLNDALSKSAYAAAQSGINDAKRALLYCRANPAVAGCGADLTRQTCPGFAATPPAALGIVSSADGSVIVGDPGLNERYTCVVITSDTMDVQGELADPATSDQSSELVPLAGVADFTQVRISWHIKTAATDPAAALSFAGGGNPRDLDRVTPAVALQWQSAWPALLRVNLMQHAPGGITIQSNPEGSLDPSFTTRSFFFYPSKATQAQAGDPVTTPFSATSRREAPCRGIAAAPYQVGQGNAQKDYACQITLNVGAAAGAARTYVQLQTFYKETDFAVELLDASGNPVAFDGVSPMIDATGAANNVFRRVITRVKFNDGAEPIPPVAIDLGGGMCKNFSVTANPGQFEEDCAPVAGE